MGAPEIAVSIIAQVTAALRGKLKPPSRQTSIMKFGPQSLDAAEGAILAHSIRLPGGAIKKGTQLTAADIDRLRRTRQNQSHRRHT